jgi:hypothetical protein
VTSNCILLKVGLGGVTYKHAGIFTLPMRAELSKVDPGGREYHADGESPFRICFRLEGLWTRPLLGCYTSPSASSSQRARMVFQYPFELCDVWKGRWFVHGVTREPQHTAGEWNIWCGKIELYFSGGPGQMDLHYADGTKVRWIIAEAGAGQFAFSASSADGITLDCRVRVEDYNRIRLHISTYSSAPVGGIPQKKPTVEYTLVRCLEIAEWKLPARAW